MLSACNRAATFACVALMAQNARGKAVVLRDTACQQEGIGTTVEMWMSVPALPSTTAMPTLLAPTALDHSVVLAKLV